MGSEMCIRDRFGKGRSVAFTSDCGPHWAPLSFVEWPGYEQLWQQIEPDQEVVEAIAFDDFLSKLSGLRAESFLNARDNTGLDMPLATFTVTYGNEQQETVTIAQVGNTYHGIHGEEDGAAIIDSTSVSGVVEAIDMVLGVTVDTEP